MLSEGFKCGRSVDISHWLSRESYGLFQLFKCFSNKLYNETQNMLIRTLKMHSFLRKSSLVN